MISDVEDLTGPPSTITSVDHIFVQYRDSLADSVKPGDGSEINSVKKDAEDCKSDPLTDTVKLGDDSGMNSVEKDAEDCKSDPLTDTVKLGDDSGINSVEKSAVDCKGDPLPDTMKPGDDSGINSVKKDAEDCKGDPLTDAVKPGDDSGINFVKKDEEDCKGDPLTDTVKPGDESGINSVKKDEEDCKGDPLTDTVKLGDVSGINSVENDAEDCKNSDKIGKWMLFFDSIEKDSDGLTEHDRFWFKVKAIVEDGGLQAASCSTAYSDGHHDDCSYGVICIYTMDYDDVDDVGRVADAIREKTAYPHVMYYKTAEATSKNLYRYKGDKRISLYKHAIRRSGETKLLQSDERGFWTPVGFGNRRDRASVCRNEAGE